MYFHFQKSLRTCAFRRENFFFSESIRFLRIFLSLSQNLPSLRMFNQENIFLELKKTQKFFQFASTVALGEPITFDRHTLHRNQPLFDLLCASRLPAHLPVAMCSIVGRSVG